MIDLLIKELIAGEKLLQEEETFNRALNVSDFETLESWVLAEDTIYIIARNVETLMAMKSFFAVKILRPGGQVNVNAMDESVCKEDNHPFSIINYVIYICKRLWMKIGTILMYFLYNLRLELLYHWCIMDKMHYLVIVSRSGLRESAKCLNCKL